MRLTTVISFGVMSEVVQADRDVPGHDGHLYDVVTTCYSGTVRRVEVYRLVTSAFPAGIPACPIMVRVSGSIAVADAAHHELIGRILTGNLEPIIDLICEEEEGTGG